MRVDLKSKAMPIVATAVTVASAVPAFCADESTIVSSMTSAFTTAANDCLTAISSVLPVVIPVVGAIAVIGIGIKIFKKVTKG